MEVGQLIAICLNHSSHTFRHGSVGIYIEQDCARVAHKTVGPSGDDNGTA